MNKVEETLTQRKSQYGEYSEQAKLSQTLKDVFRLNEGYKRLNPAQRESIDMICNKLARIINGNPNIADSWHDIAGYAELITVDLSRRDAEVLKAMQNEIEEQSARDMAAKLAPASKQEAQTE